MSFKKYLYFLLLLSCFACSKKNTPPPAPITEEPEISKNMVYFGSSDNILYAIDAETGKKRWGYAVKDSIFSSPIAGNGMVYFGVGTGIGIDDNFYALDALTGEKKWTFPLPEGTYSSPVIKDKIVYINSLKNFYALDAITGKELWSKKDELPVLVFPVISGNSILLPIRSIPHSLAISNGNENWSKFTFEDSNLSYTGFPVASDNTIYIAKKELYHPNGKLTALNLATGEEKWAFPVKDNAYMNTCLINNTICIGEGKNLVGLDLLTGKEQWRIATIDRGSFSILNVFASEDMLYLCNGGHEIEAYDINSKNRQWVYEVSDGYSYPTLANGIIYLFGLDGLIAIDAKTGKEKWAYSPQKFRWFPGWRSPCVVLDGDKVYRGMGNIKP